MRYMLMHYADENTGRACRRRPRCSPNWAPTWRRRPRPACCWRARASARTPQGARVKVEDGKATVNGPFAEAKEIIAGFAILELKSKEEAVEHAKRFARISGATQIDIRLVSDF